MKAAWFGLALLATPAQAVELFFCWQGANDYTMRGSMQFPDDRLSRRIVTEADITAFEIEGFHQGNPIGTWSLSDRTPDTTWYLRYNTKEQGFLIIKPFVTGYTQGWNANGNVDDCGEGGFGFNAGSGGQDVCVNGEFIRDSTIALDTPIQVSNDPFPPDCRLIEPMS